MKALVHTRPYLFEIQEVPDPVPGPTDLLVKVKAVGICGSDIHGATGKTGRRKPPIIMGHEASGVVAQKGIKTTSFAIGDRITFDSTIYCGTCNYCTTKRINLCDNRRVLGVSCNEYRQEGAMAEYIVIPERIAYSIPDTLSFEQACMVEALSVAMHAVQSTLPIAGRKAAVIGTGLIGLLIVQVLKTEGCKDLFAFDLDEDRLNLAKKFGATATINLSNRKQSFQSFFSQMDAVFDAIGIEESVQTCTKLIRKGGTITMVGNLAPSASLPLQEIVTKEITLRGSCASAGEYPESIRRIPTGEINVEPLISKVVSLEEGIEYFDILIHKKKSLFKVILTP